MKAFKEFGYEIKDLVEIDSDDEGNNINIYLYIQGISKFMLQQLHHINIQTFLSMMNCGNIYFKSS